VLLDAPAGKAAGAPVSGGDPKAAAETSDGSTQRTVAFILGGAGILALVTSGGIEIFNLAVTNKDAKDLSTQSNDKGCSEPVRSKLPPCATVTVNGTQQIGLIDAQKSKQQAADRNTLAAVLVGAGGVALLGASIALLLTAPSGKSAARTTPHVVPLLGQGMQGLGVVGVF
jgi:hypothetical protein